MFPVPNASNDNFLHEFTNAVLEDNQTMLLKPKLDYQEFNAVFDNYFYTDGNLNLCWMHYTDQLTKHSLTDVVAILNNELTEFVKKRPILFPQFPPSQLQHRTLHSLFSPKQNQHISNITKQRANNTCYYCHNSEHSDQLHTHALWRYDNERLIRTFVQCVCVCHTCHTALLYGSDPKSPLTAQRIRWEQFLHLLRVNGMGIFQGVGLYLYAFTLFELRSSPNFNWQDDPKP